MKKIIKIFLVLSGFLAIGYGVHINTWYSLSFSVFCLVLLFDTWYDNGGFLN